MRLLSIALLCLIGYGSAAETIHRHGTIATKAELTTASSVNSEGSHSTSKTPFSENDCSICQLQRNLVNGQLYAPVRTIAPVVQTQAAVSSVVSYFSTSCTTRSGRAPPSTL